MCIIYCDKGFNYPNPTRHNQTLCSTALFVKLTHAPNLTKFVGMLMAYLDIKFHRKLHGTINWDFMWVPVIHFT